VFSQSVRSYFRTLQRHRLAAGLNILGLSLGVAIFLLLMLFVRFETSFERWLPGSEKIYGVRQTWAFPGTPPEETWSTMGGLLEAIQQVGPAVGGVRVMDSSATVRAGGLLVEQPLRIVGSNFLNVFPFPLVEGEANGALDRPDSLVISQRLARQYFGEGNALGRQLPLAINGQQRVYRVTGVLAPMPKRTEIETEMMVRLDPAAFDPKNFYNWGSGMLKTFLVFEDEEAAEAFEPRLRALVAERAAKDIGPRAEEHLKLELIPLRSIHLIDPEDRMTVAAVALIALLTLLISCINYINLSTARSALRAREVAIRKVVGATRRMLVAQFMIESLITAGIAGIIGLAIAELALPLFNSAAGTELELAYLGPDGILLPLLLTVLLIGSFAGLYPAILLSRFAPAAVLASSGSPGGGRSGTRIREVLVVAQFAVAIAFTVATAVIFAQTVHMRNTDLGFDETSLLIMPSLRNNEIDGAQRSAFIEQATRIPGVASVTQSDSAPGDESVSNSAGVGRPGMTGQRPSLSRVTVGDRFFSTYGSRLLAGRTLSARFGMDDLYATRGLPADRAQNNVVLNRAALATLGFTSPTAALGQKLEIDTEDARASLIVAGVIDDLRFHSVRGKVSPAVYFYQSRDLPSPIGAARLSGITPAEGEKRLGALWKRIAPGIPFEAITAEQSLSAYYVGVDQRSQLFLIGSIMTVIISCLGLYGLASFTTARRTKEIGIRKALGASDSEILRLVGLQMLRPVLIANIIAWPIAYLAMRSWLNGFDRRVELGPTFFLGAAILALLIAAVTVASQVIKVARAEPARALRYE